MSRPTTLELLKYFLYLGSLGFGGPVALIGYMQRDLVEQRRWFTKEEYMKSLALSQLAPGPLAAQLAICLGYVHSRVRGATLVALAFVLPSVKGFVVGVTAAASGTIAGACFVLARRAIVDVPTLVIGLAALLLAWRFKIPEPVLIAAGAAAGLLVFSLR